MQLWTLLDGLKQDPVVDSGQLEFIWLKLVCHALYHKSDVSCNFPSLTSRL